MVERDKPVIASTWGRRSSARAGDGVAVLVAMFGASLAWVKHTQKQRPSTSLQRSRIPVNESTMVEFPLEGASNFFKRPLAPETLRTPTSGGFLACEHLSEPWGLLRPLRDSLNSLCRKKFESPQGAAAGGPAPGMGKHDESRR